jgi:hypothetical protein
MVWGTIGVCVCTILEGLEEDIFHQDNVRPHIARASMVFIEAEGIEVLLPWLP